MDELEDPLRLQQVPESLLAEVAKRDFAREAVARQLNRHGRQENLAPVPRRHDPRGTVDRRTEIVPRALLRASRMNAHANPQGAGLVPRFLEQTALRVETRS